jgi:hypothetical protein
MKYRLIIYEYLSFNYHFNVMIKQLRYFKEIIKIVYLNCFLGIAISSLFYSYSVIC